MGKSGAGEDVADVEMSFMARERGLAMGEHC